MEDSDNRKGIAFICPKWTLILASRNVDAVQSGAWKHVENTTEMANAVELTADIVSAYVSKNAVMSGDLPGLIAEIHSALTRLQGDAPEPTVAIELKPAVSIKKSITPDFIICLEDGRSFKSLKRHLRTAYQFDCR